MTLGALNINPMNLWRYLLDFLKPGEKKDTDEMDDETSAQCIQKLVLSAIWAVGNTIELVTDILGWINDNLEDLINDSTTEVNTIQGVAISEFIKQNQAAGRYTEISQSDMNVMRNSVVNVAMNAQGNITDEQMIRSNKGLSDQLQAQFQDQPILKILIPT